MSIPFDTSTLNKIIDVGSFTFIWIIGFIKVLSTVLPTVTPVATRGQMIPVTVHLGWAPGLVVRISARRTTIVSYAKVLERKVTWLDTVSFLLNNKAGFWNTIKFVMDETVFDKNPCTSMVKSPNYRMFEPKKVQNTKG